MCPRCVQDKQKTAALQLVAPPPPAAPTVPAVTQPAQPNTHLCFDGDGGVTSPTPITCTDSVRTVQVEPIFNINCLVKDGFPKALAENLRLYAQSHQTTKRFRGGYDIIQFWSGNDPLLDQVVEHVKEAFKPVLRSCSFQQGWFFLYDEMCDGVDIHADPGVFNVNVWLTPDSEIADWSKNGLIVYDVMAPDSWTENDYNANPAKCRTFIESQKGTAMHVAYAYCRMVLFNSRLFHKTNCVHTQRGTKRINCTLLFR